MATLTTLVYELVLNMHEDKMLTQAEDIDFKRNG